MEYCIHWLYRVQQSLEVFIPPVDCAAALGSRGDLRNYDVVLQYEVFQTAALQEHNGLKLGRPS
jgi:hypothetical protein